MLPDPFPVESSILSHTALSDHILPAYDLPGPRHCHLLHHGDSDTYLVCAAERRFILRVWRHIARSRKAMEAAMTLLVELRWAGVPVVTPIRRRDGSFLCAVAAPEGSRFIALFAFAPGRPPGQAITSSQAHAYGVTVADLHHVTDTLPGRHRHPALDLHQLLTTPTAMILPLLRHRAADAVFLRALARRLRAQVQDLPRIQPFHGLCHGDLHKSNLLWTEDGGVTIVDFDLCARSWRAYDLAVLVWSTRWLPQAEEVRAAYLRGYCSIRPIEPAEMAALPALVAIRDIFIMAAELRHAARGVDGAAVVDDSFFDKHFHFLRSWEEAVRGGTHMAL